MLFIFRVDNGSMINLEMNLALETVSHLKDALANYSNIPVDKQVHYRADNPTYLL